jgi:hypothetical protein
LDERNLAGSDSVGDTRKLGGSRLWEEGAFAGGLLRLGKPSNRMIAALIAYRAFRGGNQLSYFMKNMAIVGGFLAIMALGPEPYSLEARKA